MKKINIEIRARRGETTWLDGLTIVPGQITDGRGQAIVIRHCAPVIP